MGNSIQDRIMNNLTDEITSINPTDLEKISCRLMERIVGAPMQEFGINSNGRPVGGTVDGTSGNSSIVYECSTEQRYFIDKTFGKITNDIEHAIQYNSADKNLKIYLISSQKEPPTFRRNFNKYKAQKYPQYDISIYDAKKLADLIFEASTENTHDNILYRDYFPRFALEMDNYVFYGRPPRHCEKYVSDESNLSQVETHFMKYPVCIVCGLSGTGKTELAIEFAQLQEERMNILWITGDDWKENKSFCEIKGTRGERPINVVGNFNSKKTLLVIDDLKRQVYKKNFEELQRGFQIGSRVLVTSQFCSASDEYYLMISELSESSAMRILGENEQSLSQQGELVLRQCKFSPLILATIRNIAEKEGMDREEIYKNILEHPADLIDNNKESVLKRILSVLTDSDYKALEEISNSKTHVYYIKFLKKFIRPIRFSNLCDLSIIRYDSIPGFVRVHDLICSSVFTKEDTNDITMKLVEYLSENRGEISAGMLSQIYLCRNALVCEKEKHIDCHWIFYALLQITGTKERSVYQKYYNKTFAKNMELSLILCMIDSREIYFYEMDGSKDVKLKYLEKCAEEYRIAIEDLGYSKDIKAILWHHRGKSLRRCHKIEDAFECFSKAIELRPDYYSSYAQIAQLGSFKNAGNKIRDDGEMALQKLFDCWKQSMDMIPLRVMLLAIIKIRSYPKIMKQLDSDDALVKQLGDIIVTSAIDGSGQFYDAFVSFTTAFRYHHPQKCISLIKKIPLIQSMDSQNIERTQWISACEAMTNLIFSAEKIHDDTYVPVIQKIAYSFTEDIVKKISDWDAYKVRAVAKAYNLTAHPQRTMDFLSEHLTIYSENHWILYRKAEAELALSTSNSLSTIRMAIKVALCDSSAQKNISSYYFLLAKCQDRFENSNAALLSLRKAIEKCDDSVFLEELKEVERSLQAKSKALHR